MKGPLLTVAILVVLAGSVVPVAAEPPPISLGVDVGFVSRDIEEEGASVGTVIGIADSTRITARLSLQVAPRLILFGDIGGADLSVDEFDFYHSNLDLLYGGGVRFMLSPALYPRGVSVYADLTVARLNTSDRVFICTANCNSSTVLPTEELANEDLAWTETAAAIGVKGRYENLRPFGGFRVSKLDGTDHVVSASVDSKVDVRERDSVGFFLGADVLLDPEGRTAITVQVSGIDENALRFGYKVAF
jgi:hypothetical protein